MKEGRVLTEAIPDEPLGDHVLELQIAEVVAETDEARSLVFAVPDGQDDPGVAPGRLSYAPGQFLTLRVPSERTGSVARCYSLSSSPFTDDALTVTVKRTADGYASNWLCDHAHKGMRIHVLAPSGNFVPKTLDDDFLLMAAGSGITPIMSICKSALAEGGGQVTLLYALHRSARVHLRARAIHGRGQIRSGIAESACAAGAYRGVQVPGLGSVRGGQGRRQW